MLESALTLSNGKKKLLEFILSQLSEWDYVSSILLKDFNENNNVNKNTNKLEDKMDIDSQEVEKMEIEVNSIF